MKEEELGHKIYPYPEEWICPHTKMDIDDCDCLRCKPMIDHFKWICDIAKTLDDVSNILMALSEHYAKMHEEGWTIPEPIDNGHMILRPPEREGYYWVRCEKCGGPFIFQKGVESPGKYGKCDLAEDNE